MFGELFLGENTGYKYTDMVDPHEKNISEISNFDNTVCSKLASRSEFEKLQNAFFKQGKHVVRPQSKIITLHPNFYISQKKS